MARKPTPAPEITETAIVPGTLEADTAAANTLALARLEQGKRVIAMAQHLNYEGGVDAAVLENSARDAIKRIGAGIFELGGYLLLLKEACGHGQFLPALERLNLAPRAAQQYMAVVRRFATNTKLTSHLGGGNSTRLVELLPLDDEQLEDLTELGQTGELALDDVATMSVKQLRAAVREAKADKDADAALLEKKNARIDKLERDLQRVNKLAPDDQLALVKKEATAIAADAEGAILGGLRQALIKLSNHGDSAPQHVFMAGLVGQVQAQLTALRAEFNLPDASSLAQQELAAEVAEWAFPKDKD
ncbi:hypothetical protein HNP55_003557 [Paucibacter oligotrophus]|uniref:DUF3102 family protein n=1 Tax=Roseateles oligotrophus TaxID=1769250 RepID=A0A840LBA5_9BURK|nr:hypothetical protein [Roseateles oligotrophus]MBB4845011.1 hypothetical protein [Roseateles oligotrophus]